MLAADGRWARTLIVAGLTCLCGCGATNPAPAEWRPQAVAAQRSTRGGWIQVDGIDRSGKDLAHGELIAIDPAAIHVLTAAGLQSIPRAAVRRITVVGYGNRTGTLTIWAVAGGVSTLSHGGYLLFTAPMWIIGGVISHHKENSAGVWHDAEIARRFARFPQGLPPDLDPAALVIQHAADTKTDQL
jgi:hypothetical protein